MELIITEKPSVARAIAEVVGAIERQNGYLQGKGFLVSWCVGHLVELALPEVYDARYARWRYTDLPIIPEKWQYTVTAETKKQFDIQANPSVLHPDHPEASASREMGKIFSLAYPFDNRMPA